MKTAIVIGATGLVGRQLVQQLLADASYEKVLVFVRRDMGISHPNLQVHIINFDDFVSWQQMVKGDVLFSALGTTLRQAGSKAAQYTIDYTYQYNFAAAAANNGVPTYVLISSAGASPRSKIFYSRMKGELEAAVKSLPFKSISIIQPGLLAGKREQERTGEKAGYNILRFFNRLGLFKAYRPIEGTAVAKAMVNAANVAKPGIETYTLEDVFTLASKA